MPMEKLLRIIRERIGREGPLPFSTFMEMALYYPGLGYYTSERTEIGRAGDFYTSPHLHRAFGAMLGKQMEEMWLFMGRPGRFDVVEVGGGKGYLCKDMLDYLKGRDIYPAIAYTIVEMNPSLVGRQKELLADHAGGVKWAGSLKEIPRSRGCVLSNEVLDALPVHLVEAGDEVGEIYVDVDGEGFEETTGPVSSPAVMEYLDEFAGSLPPGYRTEVHLALRDWLQDISSALEEGFVLSVDYGYPAQEYYDEERSRGTLLCYHQHRVSETPLENVGLQDITAHVNFTALKRRGEEAGLKPLGFARQGPYLVSLGIDEYIAELHDASPDYAFEVAKIKGLILPGTMGESHKVMIQYRGAGEPRLRGFQMGNRLGNL